MAQQLLYFPLAALGGWAFIFPNNLALYFKDS